MFRKNDRIKTEFKFMNIREFHYEKSVNANPSEQRTELRLEKNISKTGCNILKSETCVFCAKQSSFDNTQKPFHRNNFHRSIGLC